MTDRLTPEQYVDAVRTSARLQGCVCDPDIRIPNRKARRAGTIEVVDVFHDDGCPLGGGS